jgi:Phytanoyl-CoA dioxygenase (PhyH)
LTLRATLGAGVLDLETAGRLDDDGYVVLANVLSGGQISGIRAKLAELLAGSGGGGWEPGAVRLGGLVNEGPEFDPCFTDPEVLACAAYVLGGDLRFGGLQYRAALPGRGHQPLHIGWHALMGPGGKYQVCSAIWFLDDFTAVNGATRVLPGSHRSGMAPCPEDEYRTELVTGRAGDALVFNCHLWHGGTLNQSARPRRAVIAEFTRARPGSAHLKREGKRNAPRAHMHSPGPGRSARDLAGRHQRR